MILIQLQDPDLQKRRGESMTYFRLSFPFDTMLLLLDMHMSMCMSLNRKKKMANDAAYLSSRWRSNLDWDAHCQITFSLRSLNEPLRWQTQNTGILIKDCSWGFLWQITMLNSGLSDLSSQRRSPQQKMSGESFALCHLVFIYEERGKVGQLDPNVKWNQTLTDWYPWSSHNMLLCALLILDQELFIYNELFNCCQTKFWWLTGSPVEI